MVGLLPRTMRGLGHRRGRDRFCDMEGPGLTRFRHKLTDRTGFLGTGTRRCPKAVAGRRARHYNPSLSSATGLFDRSEEHTSELQSLMRISYAVFCLQKK